jgi:hypothetical protein
MEGQNLFSRRTAYHNFMGLEHYYMLRRIFGSKKDELKHRNEENLESHNCILRVDWLG